MIIFDGEQCRVKHGGIGVHFGIGSAFRYKKVQSISSTTNVKTKLDVTDEELNQGNRWH